jgi:sigma-E factor negative regulatory protein RseA
MSQWSEGERAAREDLSSLMDGELEASAVARACGHWRDDAGVRADWHAYHLIGDVLRSDDLAAKPSRDAAFLAALRERLADEPVVFAPASIAPAAEALPSPGVATAVRRRSWATPVAVAAGFVVVAGSLVVTQMSGSLPGRSSSDSVLAKAPAAVPATAIVLADVAASAVGEPPSVVLSGQLVRDVRLDEYLAAHKKFGGSSLAGAPSGALRNVAAEANGR